MLFRLFFSLVQTTKLSFIGVVPGSFSVPLKIVLGAFIVSREEAKPRKLEIPRSE